jgi:hypothetical protein
MREELNAPLPSMQGGLEVIEPKYYYTALTLAAKDCLLYCKQWLIHGRHANSNVRNGAGALPLVVAMQHCPWSASNFSQFHLGTYLKHWSIFRPNMVLWLLEETECDDVM